MVLPPELDWTYAISSANQYQPDKRLFSELWGFDFYQGLSPGGSFDPYVGNFQRIWKDITEESTQYFVNLKLPFEQWTGDKGYVKLGIFNDHTTRDYKQDSFGNNLTDPNSVLFITPLPWDQDWTTHGWNSEAHYLYASQYDVDYMGEQKISAWYYMMDLPLTSFFKVIGGVRYEDTDLSIINKPHNPALARWIGPSNTLRDFSAGGADVTYQQGDILPSLGFVASAFDDKLTFRGSYSETVARQTFKELSPIIQTEFSGGDIFVGNPELRMSALKNYDLRLDYKPTPGGLISASYFVKKIKDPIEYVQRVNVGFTYTTPANFPEGQINGWEFEIRQNLGDYWEQLQGLTLGGNLTLIDSKVILPTALTAPGSSAGLASVGAPMTSRDMTNAPDYLYNLYLTYDLEETNTQFSIFYNVRGNTLIAGAGNDGTDYFIPSVYETPYGTLNVGLTQKIGEHIKLSFQAKNLLDPEIKTVYRSAYTPDTTKTSYKKGIDFSFGISAEFTF